VVKIDTSTILKTFNLLFQLFTQNKTHFLIKVLHTTFSEGCFVTFGKWQKAIGLKLQYLSICFLPFAKLTSKFFQKGFKSHFYITYDSLIQMFFFEVIFIKLRNRYFFPERKIKLFCFKKKK